MQVRLNLATNPMETHRRFLAAATVVAVLGGLLFLDLGWHFYSLRKADAELRARTQKVQSEIDQLQAQRRELDAFFSKQEDAHLRDRAIFLSSVIESRSFNWTQMFMDLERTLPPGVHVVRISPTLDKGTLAVKFMVGAVNEAAKLKLIKAFEDSKSFSHVRLDSERTATVAGVDPLTIEFSAVYSTPGGPYVL
jgi:Tfp pilus assembly protein PilN